MRRAATVAGVLFLVGTAAGVLSVVGAADGPDYLQAVAADGSRVVTGALFQCIMAAAYVGVALALHPVLRRHAPTAAAGFLGFRIAAGVLNVVGAIALLLLLELSTQYMRAGAPASSHFQTMGDVLRHARDLTNHGAVIIALCFGDAMYYGVLHRAKLVPGWLPVWGFIGLAAAMAASLLVFGGLIGVVTPAYVCLTAVLGLQQLALAAWLIIKGLDARAEAPSRDHVDRDAPRPRLLGSDVCLTDS
jgi:hypothetical protein